MRVSKFPYRNFEFNMGRAEALARLDGYLADLLHEKGKGTIQPLLEIPNELQQAFHINEIMDRVKKRIEEEMKNEITAEYEQKGKEHFEKIAKEYIRRLKPRFQRIAVIFRNLELLSNQTLLEQSLVAGVSAFEVYIRELVASSMMLNPSMMRRFKTEIDNAISSGRLAEYGQDAKRAQAEIVSDLVKLDINRIKNLIGRAIGLENVFADRTTERKVTGIFEVRHIVIHRAGFIDPKFKKVTKSKSSIDRQINLTRRYALNSIKTLREIVHKIEIHIHQASSVKARCKTSHNQYRM